MKIIRIALAVAGVCTYQMNAYGAPKKVSWNSHSLTEVLTLAKLPKDVQAALGVDGISDRGGKFNSTDVVDPQAPMRRFIVAGTDAGSTLVALEHGGRGYRVEAIEFSFTEGKWTQAHRWSISMKPHDLQDLVNLIKKAPK